MSLHDGKFPSPRRDNDWGRWGPSNFEPFVFRGKEYHITVNLNNYPSVSFRSGSVSVEVAHRDGKQSATVREYDNTVPVTVSYGTPEFVKVKPFWDRANTVIDELLWAQKNADREVARAKRAEELEIVDRVLGL